MVPKKQLCNSARDALHLMFMFCFRPLRALAKTKPEVAEHERRGASRTATRKHRPTRPPTLDILHNFET